MLDTRVLVIFAAAVCGIASGGLVVKHFGLGTDTNTAGNVKWRDTPWAFACDDWPVGRGFECEAAECGTKISVYVRMKKGVSKCDSGVADDDELDRVGDVHLVSRDFKAIGAGEFRSIANTPGRIRLYRAGDAYVMSLASSKNCDAFVTTALAKEPLTAKAAEALTQFTNEAEFVKWVEGLR